MSASVQPLTDVLGAEINGVDISSGSHDANFQLALDALLDRQLVVIRGQSLEPGEFAAFAARFGQPHLHILDHLRHAEYPEILPLSNVFENGEPIGVYDGAAYWHTDMSYEADPAFATLVHSIEAPERGGDTRFCNMVRAYDALPGSMKSKIEDLSVVHHYGNRSDLDQESRTGASQLDERQQARVKNVHHPLVKRHPISGRKALYAVSGSSMGIGGWPQDEGVALLDELAAHATSPEFVHGHHYRVGDVVIWDNYGTMHSATLMPPATGPDDTRILHRISVTGLPAAHSPATH